MSVDKIRSLYHSVFGSEPETVVLLPASGSSRRYYRVSGNKTVIATSGENVSENRAFVYFARYFKALDLPVPEIYGVSDDELCYLQQDLGSLSLFDELTKYGVGSVRVMTLYRNVMKLLPHFQFGHEGIDKNYCFVRESMDKRAAMWDLNYFKYSFLKPVLEEFDEDRLEDDFEKLAEAVVSNPERALMIRDFQSRNIMICDDDEYLIDFQGLRRGSCLYDVASMLWQARAGLSDKQREELFGVYMDEAQRIIGGKIENARKRYELMVLFRTLQVLGAYGFRGYFEKKTHFLMSIIPAVENLRQICGTMSFSGLDYLMGLLMKITRMSRFSNGSQEDGLTVRVTSFSYRYGVPDDLTGNGGGFVFDCRAVHNPGRYEEYKCMTGMDDAVIRFLEIHSEMPQFMEECYALVDRAVEKYIERGFTSLMVNFGCTGGQHRSVYGAESMARHINDKYGVRVVLEHTRQSVTKEYPKR
ncbi:MAG: phosphotransferase [Paramuribaculum sp.]|nr:phosphotransferase [Paramuribaculum sp.]